MPVEFKSEFKTVEVMTSDGKPITYELEYRWDPLTLRVSVICSHLGEKWRQFYSVRDEDWLNKIVGDSRKGCPFCRPTIDQIAAKFSPRQLVEEILKFDGIYVFPNLYPRTDLEAVVTSPDIHYLGLSDFNTDLVHRFLQAAFECIKKAYRKNDKLNYPVIGCNYLPPAGASLMHFHKQISMQSFPFDHVRALMESSARYKGAAQANFWFDLMDANPDREIRRKNNIYWYTPFAPAGFCEVRAIIKKPHFLQFTAEDIGDLADGISGVLRYYGEHGFTAFNYVIYSGCLDREEDGFLSGVQIVARPNPRPNYVSIDSWYMQLLLGQTIVLEKPEDLAKDMRSYL